MKSSLTYSILTGLVVACIIGIFLFPFDKFLRLTEVSENLAATTLKGSENEATSHDVNRLRWGIIEHIGKKHSLTAYYKKIASFVSKKMDLNIEIVEEKNYHSLEKDFLSNAIQIGNFSSFAFVKLQSEHEEKIVPLLAEVYHGMKYYIGYIFTHNNSPYYDLKSLKGKTFAFVSEKSASGYLFPLTYFRARGIDHDKFFKKIIFAGSHKKVVQMVTQGKADAGTTFDASFLYLEQKSKNYRILGKTKKIPSGVICMSSEVPMNIRNSFRQFLLSLTTLNQPWMVEFRKQSDITGWVDVDINDYKVVKEALDIKGKL
jgi:phosphonate transport system substrate-binding protein